MVVKSTKTAVLGLMGLALSLALSLAISSCATTGGKNSKGLASGHGKDYYNTHFADGTAIVNSKSAFDSEDSILLTFAGDIMAHTPNWSKGNFPRIYRDIEALIKESPLTFANLETPVAENRPFSNYPAFNVHGDYAQAAIDAGFNVFSLANNHTNDQCLNGIQQTKKYFDAKIEATKGSDRPVYAAGLKERQNGPWSYQVIESGNWKILFVAVTEILNSPTCSSYIDFLVPNSKNRSIFIEDMKALRKAHPCDIFVVSIHCSDPEYIFTIRSSQKNFYHELLNAGADVIWCNHPHVSKDWEVVADSGNVPRKIIFYSMGNTISGQRTNPQFAKPDTNRDYTGEGYITQVRFLKDSDSKLSIALVNPVIVTTYIAPDRFYEIRILDDKLIEKLNAEGQKRWGNYLRERKKLMEQFEGKTLWQ